MTKAEERERNWYVFIQDKHQGPYPLKEILAKELPSKDKIWLWKKGMADWDSLEKVEQEYQRSQKALSSQEQKIFTEQDFAVKAEVQYSTELLTPQPIANKREQKSSGAFLRRPKVQASVEVPPLPVIIQKQTKSESKAQTDKSRFSEVPPIPLNREGIKLFADQELSEPQIQKSKKAPNKSMAKKGILAAAVLIGVIFTTKLFWQRGPLFERPRGMTAADYERMLQVANEDPTNRVDVAFASSRDGKRLWMTTNLEWEGKASILLKSIPGKVLSQEVHEFSSDAVFSDGLVEFNRFNILQGHGHVVGYYQVEISGVEDLKNRGHQNLYPLLNHQKNLFWGKAGIFEENFAKRLENFQRYLGNKRTQHYDELLQNYATLLSLSNQAEFLLTHFGSKLKNQKTISQLEREYANTVGTVFGSMVMGTEKIYLEIKDKDRRIGNQYKQFQDTAKNFGEEVASTVEKMKGFIKAGRPSRSQRLAVAREVKLQFAAIQKSIKEQKESIQTALIKLKMGL